MIILQKEQKFCPHIKMSKTQLETRLIRQGARIGRSDISPLPHYQLRQVVWTATNAPRRCGTQSNNFAKTKLLHPFQ